MTAVCAGCGLIIDVGGHAAGGAHCLARQLAAVRTELAKAKALTRATRKYLEAHAALAAAGTTPERPAAAKRLADARIALNAAIELLEAI